MFLARHLRSLFISESPPEIAQCSHHLREVPHAAVRVLQWQSNLGIVFLLVNAVQVALSIAMLGDMCELLSFKGFIQFYWRGE